MRAIDRAWQHAAGRQSILACAPVTIHSCSRCHGVGAIAFEALPRICQVSGVSWRLRDHDNKGNLKDNSTYRLVALLSWHSTRRRSRSSTRHVSHETYHACDTSNRRGSSSGTRRTTSSIHGSMTSSGRYGRGPSVTCRAGATKRAQTQRHRIRQRLVCNANRLPEPRAGSPAAQAAGSRATSAGASAAAAATGPGALRESAPSHHKETEMERSPNIEWRQIAN